MKPSVVILSAAIAAAVGASAYLTLVLLPKERAMLAEQTAKLAEQQQALTEQRIRLEKEVSALEQVEASAALQVKATEAASENLLRKQESVNQQQRIARAAANVASASSSARVIIAEHLASHGKMCDSNSECGAPAPEGFASEALLRATIEPGGKIAMELADLFDVANPKLVMIPEWDESSFQITRWRCQTNVPTAGTALETCTAL